MIIVTAVLFRVSKNGRIASTPSCCDRVEKKSVDAWLKLRLEDISCPYGYYVETHDFEEIEYTNLAISTEEHNIEYACYFIDKCFKPDCYEHIKYLN